MKTLVWAAAACLVSLPLMAEDLHIIYEEKPHIRTSREDLAVTRQNTYDAVNAAVIGGVLNSRGRNNDSGDAAYWKAKYEDAIRRMNAYKEAADLYQSACEGYERKLNALRVATQAKAQSEP